MSKRKDGRGQDDKDWKGVTEDLKGNRDKDADAFQDCERERKEATRSECKQEEEKDNNNNIKKEKIPRSPRSTLTQRNKTAKEAMCEFGFPELGPKYPKMYASGNPTAARSK